MLKEKRLLLIGVISVVLLVGLSIVFNGKGQATQQRENETDQVPFGQKAKELDDAATPIVDFDNPSAADRIDKNARKLKSVRYDKYGAVPSNPHPHAGEVRVEPEWRSSQAPSDLPADKSDLIVEAIVAESHAFLSEDKTGVYSEFTIIVSKVLKVSSGIPVNLGDTIVAERFGGKVRYPSGQVIRCRIEGQGVPMVGKAYFFFLSKVDQDSYKLATAYEIQGNKVFALDGSRTSSRGQGGSIFDKHNGEDRDSFMGKVETALNNSHSGGTKP
jgi:hypothetical protein